VAIPFGRYQLLRKIAQGGMGQVLLAKKGLEGFEKLVVIKRILPHLVEDDEFFAMFIDEAKIAMRLDHPNIARINEFGEERGVHYLEMEYVAGEDVRRVDKRSRAMGNPLPLGLVLRIIADAAAGLDFAHKARDSKGQPLGLVHRDVSPQNILVGFDGSVKLIDFGVAKAAGRAQHTATGILKGKFPYMSPEQADGQPLDARSDIFALGIVLWELLTEKRLFKGENDLMSQRLVKACEVVPPSTLSPTLPEGLDAVVLKALAKDPNDRYPDAGAFRKALEDYALQRAISTSSALLEEFMRGLYAERIQLEADPRNLEDDSGMTGLEAPGSAMPDRSSAPTAVGRPGHDSRPAESAQRLTEVLGSSSPSSKVGLFAGLAVVVAVAAGVAWKLWATHQTEPEPLHVTAVTTPVEPVNPVKPQAVDAGVAAVVEPPAIEPLVVALTTEPAGADVELWGEKLGQTPYSVKVEKAKLPAMLKVAKDGFEAQLVKLSPDSPAALTVTLKRRVAKVTPPPVKPPDIKTSR
jgi:serine/threonine-protein kinase